MMGFSIELVGADDGDDGPFDLCSAVAWMDFCEWVENLPRKGSVLLRELVATGEVGNSTALAVELKAALETKPPESIANLGNELLEWIGVGDPQEHVAITDGEEEDTEDV